MAKKLKYDEVKEIIEKEKCILISKEYINVNSILEIKCQCGDIFKTSLSSFRNNKKRRKWKRRFKRGVWSGRE